MPWKLSNLPGGEDFERENAPVEQATAAPGEKRDVSPDCDALSAFGEVNCTLPVGHDGPHRFEWTDGE